MSRLWNVSICFVAALMLTVSHLFASPQDQYLQIYLLIQEGEKLEASGKKASAKDRYEVSLNRLEKLQKESPDWEPVIVRYRINFCRDKIQSLQNVADVGGEEEDMSLASSTPPPAVQSAPTATLSVSTPTTLSSSSETPSASDTTASSPAPSSYTPPVAETSSNEDVALLKARIKELESELAETKLKLSSSAAETTELKSRQRLLEAQIESLKQSGSDVRLNEALEQNKLLQDQLAKTKADLQKLQAGSTSITLASLQEELRNAQEQLNLANRQKDLLQKSNDQYKQQLQDLQSKLASSVSAGRKTAATESLERENKILRDVINRQLKEQARRENARRVALEELRRLSVESSTLKTQIDILSSPIVVLNNEEKEILQSLKASLVVDNKGNISTTINRPTADYSSSPKVPEEFKDVAEQAVQLFANRRFEESAAKYQTILNAHPDSLYALSNLGVVRFQQQKYAEAEKVLREAVRLAPQDAFSHSILGIVLYQQGKYDDAVQVLSRAVALDPKDPKTRNYLGIAASQKGWQEAAEQECRTAIELDNNYGDAHFNLAVIYATQNPPAKELARRHYNKALSLGVPRDDQLEKLLN